MNQSQRIFFAGLLFALAWSGCSSNRNRTHNPGFLDDKVTTQRVQSELRRAGGDFQNVHVQTSNGVVVLSGTVSSPELRSRGEEIAKNLHRVTRVENDLQVQK